MSESIEYAREWMLLDGPGLTGANACVGDAMDGRVEVEVVAKRSL
jgi:hypothetical protein